MSSSIPGLTCKKGQGDGKAGVGGASGSQCHLSTLECAGVLAAWQVPVCLSHRELVFPLPLPHWDFLSSRGRPGIRVHVPSALSSVRARGFPGMWLRGLGETVSLPSGDLPRPCFSSCSPLCRPHTPHLPAQEISLFCFLLRGKA